ncbi:hypothetical protein M501DRAFT_998227 [Patellaria atrata CBS 101060]|uniref:Fe2OG dioxygenase domain-containing protein n=1 Tax=Patellaria atrata CBS 101060 TaxID=1346257 RepID=A0A9P4VTZ4_9PEZI|nr:hypothetical protein M501DRAFT_998227 [Patellaria atrata CBS 101060]
MAPKAKKKDASTSTGDQSSTGGNSGSQVLDWPSFKPLVPTSALEWRIIMPNQILAIPSFWTSTLCKNYVSFLSSLPLTTTPGKPKRGEATRVNDRFQVDDPAFAERLWSGTGLKDLVLGNNTDIYDSLSMSQEERRSLWGGEVACLNPNIRIYRYRKGQFFDQHYDDSNNVVIPGNPPINAKTTWTLLLYLTSPATGCIGGETVFYPDPLPRRKTMPKTTTQPKPVVVELEVGMALLHRHGADCMLHEGREVLEGEKWIIRSDLCVKR